MRDGSLSLKAGVGLGLVLITSVVLVLSSPCRDCDTSRISASDPGAQPPATIATPAASPPVVQAGPELESAAGPILSSNPAALDETIRLGRVPQPTIITGDDAESTSTTGDGDPDAEPDPDGSSTTVTTTSGATTTTAAPQTTTTTPTAPPPTVGDSVPANGEVFYVSSGSGNDGNDGLSTSRPWRSLAASIKRLQPGQTLLVMNGEYKEVKAAGIHHYSVDRGGSAGNWIKIGAAPGHNPVIVASQGSGILVHVPYVEVSGLTVRGSGFNADNNWGVGIAVTDTHHVRVVGNRVSHMPVSGISVTNSSNFQVLNNDVSQNSFWSPLQGSGISVWRSKNQGFGADGDGYHDRIVGNRVYGNENKVYSSHYEESIITDGNGIIVDRTTDNGYTGRTLIANNLIYNNGGRGVIVWRSNNVDIMFNTAYQNGQTDGIAGGATELAAGLANDVVIANNVGWARSGLPAFVFDRVTGGQSYNNVLVTDSPSGQSSSRDIMHSGNPGFRNPSTNPGSADFRPTSGSVLKGTAVSAPSFIKTDLVGTNRWSGTPDIGAFEAEAGRR